MPDTGIVQYLLSTYLYPESCIPILFPWNSLPRTGDKPLTFTCPQTLWHEFRTIPVVWLHRNQLSRSIVILLSHCYILLRDVFSMVAILSLSSRGQIFFFCQVQQFSVNHPYWGLNGFQFFDFLNLLSNVLEEAWQRPSPMWRPDSPF